MGEEQRRFERIRAAFQVECQRYGALAETWRRVVAIDLSAGGLAFHSDEPFEAGETLEVRIALPGARAPLVLRGLVVRSDEVKPGVIRCALEFSDVAPDNQAEIDELVRFLKSRPESE
jgi:c-di-GMP-binding flagellar brake protein YcgR